MSTSADLPLLSDAETSSKLPGGLRRLFALAPFASAAAPIGYGIAGYFMAIQVQLMDPSTKVASLGLINTLAAVAAMLAQPIFGVLSDRTRTRWGARHPWMIVGAAIGTVAMLTAGLAPNLAVLIICIMVLQFGFNAWQGPFSALLPDRVPIRFRGRYSTVVGLGSLLGGIIGPIIGSGFAQQIALGYSVIGLAILVLILCFVLFVPGHDNRDEPRRSFSFGTFIAAFWVNPVRYPDFFWGFVGRFLLVMGFYMTSTYGLYIAQDYIGLSLKEATTTVPLLSLVGLPGMIVATAVAGPLSDRLGRRKPIVLIGGLLIAAGAFMPLLMPSVGGLMVQAIIAMIGFGAFMSVDQALMSMVLPDPDDYGKDLGVLNLAATLPGTVAPAFAGVIVLNLGYAALFPIVGVIGVAGALAVLPIRGVD